MAFILNTELGYVYDTMRFFSLYFRSWDDVPEAFLKLESDLIESGVKVEQYLLPLYYTDKNYHSWFSSLFHQDRDRLTIAQIKIVLGNRQYLTGKLLNYYFPNATHAEKIILKNASEPAIVEIIKRHVINPQMELYILYILLHLEKTLDDFKTAVLSVYEAVQEMHRRFLAKENPFSNALNESVIMNKLTSIAGLEQDLTLNCALSLLAPDLISCSLIKSQSIILGVNFRQRVETEYKYCDVTPYSFATGIGNSVKYKIFEILLKNSPKPVSTSDIAKQYYSSRNSLHYNLKEMLNSRIIEIDHVQGQTNFYKVNMEYIQFVGEKLLLLCGKDG